MQNESSTNKAKASILDKPIPKTKGDVCTSSYLLLKNYFSENLILFSYKG